MMLTADTFKTFRLQDFMKKYHRLSSTVKQFENVCKNLS